MKMIGPNLRYGYLNMEFFPVNLGHFARFPLIKIILDNETNFWYSQVTAPSCSR